jgi:hypothetical protein
MRRWYVRENLEETHRLPRETPTVDRCWSYGKRVRIRGREVPSGNGSCLLHSRGRGGSVSDSSLRTVVTPEWRALPEEWTQWWWATLPTGPYCFGVRQLRESGWRQRRAYGKRDVDGMPRVRRVSGNPATKGDESKTREDIEAGGTATAKPCYHSTFHIGLTTIHTTRQLYLHHPPLLSKSSNFGPFTSVRSVRYKIQIVRSLKPRLRLLTTAVHDNRGPCTRRTGYD